MSGKIEINREGEIDYAKPLPRALLRDSRLSFGARGLFAFLWDLPRGWTIRLIHLIRMAPEGRDALRSRLRELGEVGAIRIEPIRVDGGRVAGKRWILVAADQWAIEAALQSESTEERVFRSSVDPIIGNSAPKGLQGSKVLQQEAAAPCAPAHGPADAAASKETEAKRRHPRRTKNGIECWYPCEDAPAAAIEASATPEQVAAAVAAIRARQNAVGKQTSPVPALVEAEIERQHREHLAVEQRAVTAQRIAASDALDIDPSAQEKGAQKLSPEFQAKLTQKRATQEATL